MHSLPDDPHRVAPPHQAPGEIDPYEALRVSDEEALRRVLTVMNSHDHTAFGMDGDQWADWLLDSYDEPRKLLFLALLDESEKGRALLRLTRWKLARLITDTANDWLAEASDDELEQEGWV